MKESCNVWGRLGNLHSANADQPPGDRSLPFFFFAQFLHSLEVMSDYGERYEGIRVKHVSQKNSVKAYDNSGSILRIETTINNGNL
jgi:hypothetical protein